MGYRSDHLPFVLLLGISFLLTEGSHRFFIGFLGLALSWILLDSLRIIPSYLYNEVHIEDIYNAELSLFGIGINGETITPNNFLKMCQHPVLDFLTGLTYLLWMPVPFAFGIYLFCTNRNLLIRFGWAFFFTNVLGVILYYSYPAAPPWYVDLYGFEEHLHIPGSAAGLISFDQIIGVDIFQGIYEKSFNVFGAVPSLHSAYPVVTVYYAWKCGLKWGFFLLCIFMLSTWFSAVYSIHHYIIDVILGIFCAIFALVIFETLIAKPKLRKLIDNLSVYLT